MPRTLDPFRWLLFAVAGWMNHEQQQVLDYLREENRILYAQLGTRRLRFDDEQRSYLRRHSALSRASSRQTVRQAATSWNAQRLCSRAGFCGCTRAMCDSPFSDHSALNSSRTMGSLRRHGDNSRSKVQNVRTDSSAVNLARFRDLEAIPTRSPAMLHVPFTPNDSASAATAQPPYWKVNLESVSYLCSAIAEPFEEFFAINELEIRSPLSSQSVQALVVIREFVTRTA